MIDHFYAEDWFCSDCEFSGIPEKIFEPISKDTLKNSQEIIFVCPDCGYSEIQGERIEGEEFYY